MTELSEMIPRGTDELLAEIAGARSTSLAERTTENGPISATVTLRVFFPPRKRAAPEHFC